MFRQPLNGIPEIRRPVCFCARRPGRPGPDQPGPRGRKSAGRRAFCLTRSGGRIVGKSFQVLSRQHSPRSEPGRRDAWPRSALHRFLIELRHLRHSFPSADPRIASPGPDQSLRCEQDDHRAHPEGLRQGLRNPLRFVALLQCRRRGSGRHHWRTPCAGNPSDSAAPGRGPWARASGAGFREGLPYP